MANRWAELPGIGLNRSEIAERRATEGPGTRAFMRVPALCVIFVTPPERWIQVRLGGGI